MNTRTNMPGSAHGAHGADGGRGGAYGGSPRGGHARPGGGSPEEAKRLLREAQQHLEAIPKDRGLADRDAGLSAPRLVEIAAKAGKAFAGAVKTSQIRKFHGHLVRFVTRVRTRHEDVAEVQLLKYHLAYAAGRDFKLRDFTAFFTAALDRVQSREDLERFKQLYDATLAYHKFEGGKE